jgi:DnaJ-class molecular chaperone
MARPVYTDGDFEPCEDCGGEGTIEFSYGPAMSSHRRCDFCDGSGEVFVGEEAA